MKRLTTTLALLLVLTACGSEDPGTDPGTGPGTGSGSIAAAEPFNDADVAFATAMVPHHAEALAMVDQTRGRDLSPEVAALAEQIQAAQAPEIETMTGWLQDWDQPVPETVRDHANAHGDGHEGDLAELESATDAEFEDLWLELMIEHHRAAITMSETEIEDGELAAATGLAEQIVESQQAEIDQMEQLLAG